MALQAPFMVNSLDQPTSKYPGTFIPTGAEASHFPGKWRAPGQGSGKSGLLAP